MNRSNLPRTWMAHSASVELGQAVKHTVAACGSGETLLADLTARQRCCVPASQPLRSSQSSHPPRARARWCASFEFAAHDDHTIISLIACLPLKIGGCQTIEVACTPMLTTPRDDVPCTHRSARTLEVQARSRGSSKFARNLACEPRMLLTRQP